MVTVAPLSRPPGRSRPATCRHWKTATRLKAWSELHSFGRPRYIAKNRSLFGPPTSAPVTRRIDRWAENPFPKCWSDDRNPLGHWRLWRVFRKQGKIFLSEVWRHRSCAKPSRASCPLDHWTFSLFDTFYAQFFPQEAGPVSCWTVARVSTSTGQKDGMIEFLARFSTQFPPEFKALPARDKTR